MYLRFFILFLCIACLPIFGQENTITTKPQEVTVFLQSAKVTESATVSLQSGRNSVQVTGLPNTVDINSYQIGLGNGATLLSVSPQTNYLKPEEYRPEEQKLIDEKSRLETEEQLYQAEITTLNGELALIDQNKKIGNNDSGWTAEQLVMLAEYYTKRTLAIRKELVLKNQEIATLRKKLSDLENEIQDSLKDRDANRQELILEIDAIKATKTNLSITYITRNSGWQPFYDIRAKSIDSPLELITKAKIYQQTGKDWKNVKLSVSTYLPKTNQNRPILNPFYVREAQYRPTPIIDYETEEVVINTYQMRDDKTKALDQVAVSEVLSQQFNTLYKISGRQNLTTNNNSQTFILDKQEIEAEYTYYSVPKITEEVFLLANLKNWQSLNLMLTEANIYFENNFIGKTVINPNYTKDKFPLSLGVEERIVVKRRMLNNLKTTKYLTSKRVDNYAYEIKIRNNTGKKVTLELLDQIPITQNNKIEILDIESESGDLDKKTGSILWTLDFNSGGSKTVNFAYKLKYPKDMNLQFY